MREVEGSSPPVSTKTPPVNKSVCWGFIFSYDTQFRYFRKFGRMSGNTDFIRLYTETEDGLQAAFYQANDDYLQI